MKLAVTAAAAVAALGIASGTASAQYPALVPHRGHYHVVPTYSPPVVSGYGYPAYSPGLSVGGFYSSPGFSLGGVYGRPAYSSGYGWGGYGHHHQHHGHGYGHGHHHHHR